MTSPALWTPNEMRLQTSVLFIRQILPNETGKKPRFYEAEHALVSGSAVLRQAGVAERQSLLLRAFARVQRSLMFGLLKLPSFILAVFRAARARRSWSWLLVAASATTIFVPPFPRLSMHVWNGHIRGKVEIVVVHEFVVAARGRLGERSTSEDGCHQDAQGGPQQDQGRAGEDGGGTAVFRSAVR